MNVYVFNWKNFKFNPLRPPEGCSPVDWMQVFIDVFNEAYILKAGGESILSPMLKKLFTAYGVFEGSGTYPTILDLKESVDRYVPERNYGREADFLDSLKNRLNGCVSALGGMFDCDRGFSIEDLLNKQVIFELDGLLYRHQKFLVTIILRFIYQYRISNQHRGSLRHVIFFDEAKMVYHRSGDFIQDSGPSEMTQLTTLIREFGEGIVASDQMPTDMSNSIKASVNTIICMSQSGGPNISEMSKALNLDKDQTSYLTTLTSDKRQNLFEAIAKTNRKCPTPFVIEVIPCEFKKELTEYELNRHMQLVLEHLNSTVKRRTTYREIMERQRKEAEAKRREEAQHEADYLEPKEQIDWNYLIRIINIVADEPFIDQKEIIARLQSSHPSSKPHSSSTNDRHFKELVEQKLADPQRIGFGKGHGIRVHYQITPKGMRYAHIKKFVIPGKGDFEHKFWQHTVKNYYKSMGHEEAEIEKRYGNKNVDIGLILNSKKTAIEVELSPKHLEENIQKDFEAGCEFVIVAVKSISSAKFYKKKVQKIFGDELLKKIDFRILAHFLP